MITKQDDFFKVVSKKSEMTNADVRKVYNAIVETLIESANSEDETRTVVPQIGTLIVKIKDAYTAKNPKNGEEVEVAASRRARIKINSKLTEAFNVEKKTEKKTSKKTEKVDEKPVKKAIKKIAKKK